MLIIKLFMYTLAILFIPLCGSELNEDLLIENEPSVKSCRKILANKYEAKGIEFPQQLITTDKPKTFIKKSIIEIANNNASQIFIDDQSEDPHSFFSIASKVHTIDDRFKKLYTQDIPSFKKAKNAQYWYKVGAALSAFSCIFLSGAYALHKSTCYIKCMSSTYGKKCVFFFLSCSGLAGLYAWMKARDTQKQANAHQSTAEQTIEIINNLRCSNTENKLNFENVLSTSKPSIEAITDTFLTKQQYTSIFKYIHKTIELEKIKKARLKKEKEKKTNADEEKKDNDIPTPSILAIELVDNVIEESELQPGSEDNASSFRDIVDSEEGSSKTPLTLDSVNENSENQSKSKKSLNLSDSLSGWTLSLFDSGQLSLKPKTDQEIYKSIQERIPKSYTDLTENHLFNTWDWIKTELNLKKDEFDYYKMFYNGYCQIGSKALFSGTRYNDQNINIKNFYNTALRLKNNDDLDEIKTMYTQLIAMYKIHLQPASIADLNYMVYALLKYLKDETHKTDRNAFFLMKVASPKAISSVFNSQENSKTCLPLIVIYPSAGKNNLEYTLNITCRLFGHMNHLKGKDPRYSKQVKGPVFYTQGDGSHKEESSWQEYYSGINKEFYDPQSLKMINEKELGFITHTVNDFVVDITQLKLNKLTIQASDNLSSTTQLTNTDD